MAGLRLDISMSLDGFVAGPNATLDEPLGRGGELLHEWVYPLKSWREEHGETGGETGGDDDVVAEHVAATGAVIMGRRMFSGGEGPWEDDPNADGWWGDDPPFHVPVFVLTRHEREPVVKEGGTTFTFVTDGIEPALEEARAAAEERDVVACGRRERRAAVPPGRPARRAPGAHRPGPAGRRRPALRRPRRRAPAAPRRSMYAARGSGRHDDQRRDERSISGAASRLGASSEAAVIVVAGRERRIRVCEASPCAPARADAALTRCRRRPLRGSCLPRRRAT